MNRRDFEQIGSVFVVICGIRQCLICDRVFTPRQAAEHAKVPCCAVVKRLANKTRAKLFANFTTAFQANG